MFVFSYLQCWTMTTWESVCVFILFYLHYVTVNVIRLNFAIYNSYSSSHVMVPFQHCFPSCKKLYKRSFVQQQCKDKGVELPVLENTPVTQSLQESLCKTNCSIQNQKT